MTSPKDPATHLARLRETYGDASAADVHDPAFKTVADMLFSEGRRAKPYEGIASFLDAPMRPGAVEMGRLDDLDIALIGVPMDLGVTNRPGARFGPRAVRQVERIGPYHHVHKSVPASQCRIADVGDLPFRSRYSLADSHEDIEAHFRSIVKAGVAPVAVGGDHSISLPILKAIGASGPVGMIHIDAHCDTGGPFEGSKFHHGGPFRAAVLDGVLDPTRTIQIGIRGNAEFLWEFSYDSGMTVIHAEAIDTLGIAAIVQKVRAVIGDGPAYVSFDVDSLDPAFAPGTGTPEVGGLTTREALAILRGCKGLDIIGGDVVEVAPSYDPTTNTAQAAAQMLFEIVALVADCHAKRRRLEQ